MIKIYWLLFWTEESFNFKGWIRVQKIEIQAKETLKLTIEQTHCKFKKGRIAPMIKQQLPRFLIRNTFLYNAIITGQNA